MAKKPVTPDADKLYVITFSRAFEHGGRKYIPRADQKVRLKGTIVAEIADKIDNFEEA